MAVVSVYSTFADLEEANRIGRTVVEERLAACVNILGACQAIYHWQGDIESANEVAAVFKTSVAVADRLVSRIAALHSYEVPPVVVWPIASAFGPYADWIEQSVA